MQPEPNEHLVVFNYKGYVDSVVISLKSDESLHDVFKRRGYNGVIENTYEPGLWHYDPETLVPIPGEST